MKNWEIQILKKGIRYKYRTARNFGGSKFLRIAKFLVLASFNLTNLWPCAIEDVHNDSKWQIFYFGE